MSSNIAGIILAGGKSRRFGTPKAFALKEGIPFYEYTIHSMIPYANVMVIVTNKDLANRFNIHDARIKLITDQLDYAGLGPLAGIYSGMESVDAEWYFVAPIDVPFIEQDTFKTLLQHMEVGNEVIVPIVKGRLQPLISIYHHSIKSKIKEQLESNELSPKQLFAKSHVNYIEMDEEKPFRNINSQDDFRKFIQKENIGEVEK